MRIWLAVLLQSSVPFLTTATSTSIYYSRLWIPLWQSRITEYSCGSIGGTTDGTWTYCCERNKTENCFSFISFLNSTKISLSTKFNQCCWCRLKQKNNLNSSFSPTFPLTFWILLVSILYFFSGKSQYYPEKINFYTDTCMYVYITAC